MIDIHLLWNTQNVQGNLKRHETNEIVFMNMNFRSI